MYFEVAAITIAWWIPPLVAFVLSLFLSTAGLSGAFVLLPFQVSVLGFTGPAATATNHLYNVISLPSGIFRLVREKRMVWPLTLVVILGTLPGVVVGFWARVHYLTDPARFKIFIGFVLLLIAGRLVWDMILRPVCVRAHLAHACPAEPECFAVTEVHVTHFSWRRLSYTFSNREFHVSVPLLFLLSSVVGVIGGAYGVGGGAIIGPFLITFFGLPVHTTAGTTFLGTFSTSLFAVCVYNLLGPLLEQDSLSIQPDWKLGLMFGIGGFFGVLMGSRLQKRISQRAIKTVLAVFITLLGLRYIAGIVW